MIPYLGCQSAREMLDAFVDGELGVPEQVAMESHLRWCATCRARIEDMAVIGASLRIGAVSMAPAAEEVSALTAAQAGVLTRVSAEQDQSFRVRTRELFSDRRLLWPALGATLAVVLGLFGVGSVLHAASNEHPDSLAAMIEALATTPISAPRAMDAGVSLDALADDEAEFMVAAEFTRDGRVGAYELLRPQPRQAVAEAAVLRAIKHSRFAPAQAQDGRPVAVKMIWMIARTTVKGARDFDDLPLPARAPAPDPPKRVPAEPERPAPVRASSTA